jgi:ParB family chromosome partitioning protein
MSDNKPRRLGRGLEALLGSAPTIPAPNASPAAQTAANQAPNPAPIPTSPSGRLAIARIRANPYQPRKTFRPEELAELEASLKINGLLQPITVRPAPNGDGYELVAGERRLRAATRLGWTEIAANIKELDDRTLLTLALVENLQRADLNPMEEAEGYQQLMDDFGLTQAEVAEAVGKERPTVANLLRLITLPTGVQTLVRNGALSLGHAKVLLGVRDERLLISLAKRATEEGISVREIERLAKESATRPGTTSTTSSTKPTAGTSAAAAGTGGAAGAALRKINDDLRRKLQTDVQVVQTGTDKGEIRIAFYSNDDLDRVLELILGSTRSY